MNETVCSAAIVMRGDTTSSLLPGVAVIESEEDEDSTTSLDFNTSDFLPFWDYTEVKMS